MHLSAIDRAKIRRALRRRRVEHDPSQGGELNITPFLDVVVNVMLFMLATTAVTLTTVEVRASLAPLSPHGNGERTSNQLSATLTHDGVVFATPNGVVAPGCHGVWASPSAHRPASIGRSVDGTLVDAAAVTRCARTLHDELGGDSIIVSADADVPYADVIQAMDALRADGETELFPRVIISAGVR